MAFLFKNIKENLIGLVPLLLLFGISLSGLSVIEVKFFSANLLYVLIYFWVLRQPDALGYGFIFLSGIIADVLSGLPMGSFPLCLLTVSSVAAYVRNVTVRLSLLNDWISFIPAILLGNFVFFLTLYFSDFSINYLHLFTNSIFTFFLYPLTWVVFSLMLKWMR